MGATAAYAAPAPTAATSATKATAATSATSATKAIAATSAASVATSSGVTKWLGSLNVTVAAAQAAGYHPAVAILDTQTGLFYGAGDVDGQYPTESVVKVLIAARLLAEGKMTGETAALATVMITESDDSAADQLWGEIDGPTLISWAEQRYGITGLGAAPNPSSQWGNTKITARGLVQLYAALKSDPAVSPWLLQAMHAMQPTGSDGTDQTFGLPSTSSGGGYKQGWGGDDDNFNSEGLLSTGYLGNDRFAVAVFVQHIPWVSMQTLVPVINGLGQAAAVGVSTVTASAQQASAPQAAAPQASAQPSGAPEVVTAQPAAAASAAKGATGSVRAARVTGQSRTSAGSALEDKVIIGRVLIAGAIAALLIAMVVTLLVRRRPFSRRPEA